MAKGDDCKVPECPHTQPCPYHTRLGHDRKHKRPNTDDPTRATHPEAKREHDRQAKKRAKHRAKAKPGQMHPDKHAAAVVNLFGDSAKAKEHSQSLDEYDHNEEPRPGLDDTNRPHKFGKRWRRMMADVRAGETTWDRIVDGLSAEEVARCQLRNKNGGFSGRPPTFVPREFLMACQRSMMERFNDDMRGHLDKATQSMLRIADDPTVDPKDRFKMYQYIIERVVGKVPDKVEVSGTATWEHVFTDIIADIPDDLSSLPEAQPGATPE